MTLAKELATTWAMSWFDGVLLLLLSWLLLLALSLLFCIGVMNSKLSLSESDSDSSLLVSQSSELESIVDTVEWQNGIFFIRREVSTIN